jgi:hypothetical protein
MTPRNRKDDDSLDYAPLEGMPTLQEVRYTKEAAEATVAAINSEALSRPKQRADAGVVRFDIALSPKELSAKIALIETHIVEQLLKNIQEGLITASSVTAADLLCKLGIKRLQIAELVGENSAGAGSSYIIIEPKSETDKLRKFGKVPSSVP